MDINKVLTVGYMAGVMNGISKRGDISEDVRLIIEKTLGMYREAFGDDLKKEGDNGVSE